MNESAIIDMKRRFGIVGNDPALLHAIDVAIQVAPTELAVLITGESGVGKEFLPKIIHANSPRRHAKYIAVNCGAIPEGTVDSELFGHVKGSFTGAIEERKGYFSEADGGVIFLDEIGELPSATQARLLRVIEYGEFMRVGSSTPEHVNVRVVAATNVDLQQAVAEGRFRKDLYYRLSAIPITLPPLRERGNDILLLFRKFATDFVNRYGMEIPVLTEEAKQMLISYPWPGNIRELKNVAEQASFMGQQGEVTAAMLATTLHPIRSTLPVSLQGVSSSDGNDMGNGRELIYRMIFELKNEIQTLKSQLEALQQGRMAAIPESAATTPVTTTIDISEPEEETEHIADIIDDSSMTLQETEREQIHRALIRHKGRRKETAQDLQISERTLYRKIQKYNLDSK